MNLPYSLSWIMFTVMAIVFVAMFYQIVRFYAQASPNPKRRETCATEILLTLLMILITVLLVAPALCVLVY